MIPPPAIDAFWQWWTATRGTFAAAFDGKTSPPADLIDAMTLRVRAIDEGLDWEFGAGERSRHRLCLSAKGDPVVRVVAERWLACGPDPDEVFEYYPSRQPGSPTRGAIIEIAGHTVPFDEFAFDVHEDEAREVFDVRCHHAAFAKIDDRNLRVQIMFLALDDLLGEDGVERWLGRIEESPQPVGNPIGRAAFLARVGEHAGKATGDRWAVLRGEREGKPVFVNANLALKRIDHLLLDMHLIVDLPLDAPNENGLPLREEAMSLDALEDELLEALGEHGRVAGHETTDGHREIHMRVMESGPARGIVEGVLARHLERRSSVVVEMDPQWTALARWR